jgi:hypothetical protein
MLAEEGEERRGFVSTWETRHDSFCDPDGRRLTLTANRKGDMTFMTLYVYHIEDARVCSSPQPTAGRSTLKKWMPRFAPLDEAETLGAGSGLSGSGESVGDSGEDNARIRTTLSMDQVVSHFAAQLGAEGWTLDSQSMGSRATTQIWTREIETHRLVGTLSAFQLRKKEIGVEFDVTIAEK